ncbi:hypothetical protein JZ751_019133 [Albula glossodonta]|uniref:Uncharacterized protein n=1 Tax=Albula glossodonta TaxID=121402 RepID=A0A8T2NPR3_9TELE|nr:hypothetical protein JZ751_019133 [Albula glossodonta]
MGNFCSKCVLPCEKNKDEARGLLDDVKGKTGISSKGSEDSATNKTPFVEAKDGGETHSNSTAKSREAGSDTQLRSEGSTPRVSQEVVKDDSSQVEEVKAPESECQRDISLEDGYAQKAKEGSKETEKAQNHNEEYHNNKAGDDRSGVEDVCVEPCSKTVEARLSEGDLECVRNVDPSLKSECVKSVSPSLKNESIQEMKPTTESKLIHEVKPTIKNDCLHEVTPAIKNDSLHEVKPTIKNDSVQEVKPSDNSEHVQEVIPSMKNDPVQEVNPSIKNDPVQEVDPSIKNDFVQEVEPCNTSMAKDVEPSIKNEPAESVDPSFKIEPVDEANPPLKSEPMESLDPSLQKESIKVVDPSLNSQSTHFEEPLCEGQDVKAEDQTRKAADGHTEAQTLTDTDAHPDTSVLTQEPQEDRDLPAVLPDEGSPQNDNRAALENGSSDTTGAEREPEARTVGLSEVPSLEDIAQDVVEEPEQEVRSDEAEEERHDKEKEDDVSEITDASSKEKTTERNSPTETEIEEENTNQGSPLIIEVKVDPVKHEDGIDRVEQANSEEDLYRGEEEIAMDLSKHGRTEPLIQITLPGVQDRSSVAPGVDILSYSQREWKGNTAKSALIRKGYSELSQSFGDLRSVRGDNYCALRATLFQLLSNSDSVPAYIQDDGLSLLPERLEAEMEMIEGWRFPLGRSQGGETGGGVEKLKDHLELLQKRWRTAAEAGGAEERRRLCESVFQGGEEEHALLEALKLLMLNTAAKLHARMQRGEDVPIFCWLLFARDTSDCPRTFLANHLSHVGFSGGLEQVSPGLDPGKAAPGQNPPLGHSRAWCGP